MEINYDEETDALYIKFVDGEFSENKKLDKNTILDLDKKGNILGIEILWASEKIPKESLLNIHVNNIVENK